MKTFTRNVLNVWWSGFCISLIMFNHTYWLLPLALSIFVTGLVLFINVVFSS